MTVTESLSDPNELVQDTVMVFAPGLSVTLLVVASVVAPPLTVQVVPAGIEASPPTVKATLTLESVVLVPSAGSVIATAGPLPWLTLTVSVSLPKSFVQLTVIVLAPGSSETLLVVASVVALPFTVQVVPLGIEAAPSTVNATFVVDALVLLPSAGDVIATTGAEP